jgi:hypothetical protein
MFLVCSYCRMTRIDDDTLSLHLEVALSGTDPALLDGLANPDRLRRAASVASLARQMAQRLRCFEILTEESQAEVNEHPSLFSDEMVAIAR